MSTESLLHAAKAEELRLQQELKMLGQRLRGVQKLIESYGERSQRRRRTRNGGGLSAVVAAETKAYLKTISRRAHSPEIAEALQARGIDVSYKVVSAILSNHDDFDNVRGEGGYGFIAAVNQAD